MHPTDQNSRKSSLLLH